MTTIPLISGATHVLKLTPNNALIPSTISNIDNFIKGSLLSNAKFNNWKNIANSAYNIGVVDSGSNNEVARYIDPNFNMSIPEGSIWFLGNAEADRYYYLQTGASLNKNNSSSVFTTPNYLASHGFLNASGNPTDRCGNNNGTSLNLSYEEAGEIDVGNGYPDTHNGQVNLGAITDLNSISNFTITMILKLSDFDGYWFNHLFYNGIFLDSDGVNVISPSVGDVNYAFTPADEITLDEFFQVDIVFDGTLTDGDVDAQDLLRYKIYINGTQITLTVASGHCPSVTKSAGLGHFVYGEDLANTGMYGVIDEARINLRSFSDDEITVHYNQWFDADNYWTVTVQPVITSVRRSGKSRYRLRGSGFKPTTINPTGNINGAAYTIISISDTEIEIQDESGDACGLKSITLTNSDNESDSITYNYYSKQREVIMFTKCYPVSDVWLTSTREDAPAYCDIIEIRNDPATRVQQPETFLRQPTNYTRSAYLDWVLQHDPNILRRPDGMPASREEHIIAAQFIDSGIRVGDLDTGNNIEGILKESNNIVIGEYDGGIIHGDTFFRIYRNGTTVEKLWFIGV